MPEVENVFKSGASRNNYNVCSKDIRNLAFRIPFRSGDVAGGNLLVPRVAEDLTSCQEAILFLVHWMRFHLHHVLASHREYPRQTARRLDRKQGEEVVGDAVAPLKSAVNSLPVEAVPKSLLAGLEREVPPHRDPARQQTTPKYVGTKVHVMMAINPFGLCSVQAVKFFSLGFHYVLERCRKR